MVLLQDLTTSLAAAKEQLQQARRGFEALVAYFGENPVAFQNDGDFWRDILTFVTAFSAAQQNALAFNKVGAVQHEEDPSLSAPALLFLCQLPLLHDCTGRLKRGSAALQALHLACIVWSRPSSKSAAATRRHAVCAACGVMLKMMQEVF